MANIMIGRSAAFKAVERLISQIAAYAAPVLIEGETGTGKELVARALHYASPRRDAAFIPVNCGALPDTLIENELFGHAKGAFTDARRDQPGLIALARGGTLFLDEIDALSARSQVTLLRFLQDQHFRPLGGGVEHAADVRVIAASNRDLAQDAAAGGFRQDLLYRLRLLEVRMPPLRERRDDIPELAHNFIAVASARYCKPALPLHPATLAWFAEYRWPGNVRELENLVCREFLLCEGPLISIARPADLSPRTIQSSNYLTAKREAILAFETRFLSRLISETGGNISAAARLSGTERRHLGKLLRKHQLLKTTVTR